MNLERRLRTRLGALLFWAALATSAGCGGAAKTSGEGPSTQARLELAADHHENRRRVESLIDKGQLAQARALASAMLARAEQAENSNQVVDARVMLAGIHARLGDRKAALEQLERAHALIQSGYGKRHRELVARALASARGGSDFGDSSEKMLFLESAYQSAAKPAESISRIVELISDEDVQVRKFAAFVLSGYGARADAGRAALLALLLEEDAELRTAGVIGLAAIGPAALPSILTYADFPDLEVRTAVFAALSQMTGDLDAQLVATFEQLSARNRRALIDAVARPGLFKTPHHAALDARIERAALDDPDRSVRRAARTSTLVRKGSLRAPSAAAYESWLERFEAAAAKGAIFEPSRLLGELPDEFRTEPALICQVWGDVGLALQRKGRPEARTGFDLALDSALKLRPAVGSELRDLRWLRALGPGHEPNDARDLQRGLDEVLSRHVSPAVAIDVLLLTHALGVLRESADTKAWRTFEHKHRAQLAELERTQELQLFEILLGRDRESPEDASARLAGSVLTADRLKAAGRITEAEVLYRRAFAARGERAATTLLGLAAHHTDYLDTLLALGRYPAAFELGERSRRFEEQLLGLQGSRLFPGAVTLVELERAYAQDQYDWLMAFLRRHADKDASFVARAFEFQRRRKAYVGRLKAEQAGQRASLPALPPERALLGALGSDGALFDFVEYRDHEVSKDGSVSSWRPSRYAAFVRTDQGLSWVDLGEAEPIDAVATKFRRAILTPNDQGAQREVVSLGRRLFDALLAPLGVAALSKPRWFLSLDGDLALIPFAALSDPAGFLVDSRELVFAASSRQVAPPAKSGQLKQARLIADPDYDLLLPTRASQAAPAGRSTPLRRWPRLAGTRKEAALVQAALSRAGVDAPIAQGPDATAELLLSPFAGQVLHVATHGYWIDAPGPREDLRSLIRRGVESNRRGGPRGVGGIAAPAGKIDPLGKSPSQAGAGGGRPGSAGLVLAGANRSAAAIVTAEALAQAPPFSDLELAVLSACDTGLGTSWRGEGILGLQSALFARGAHNVLVSLWTIADEATALLMAEFYATLAAGAPATVALQRAARSLKARYPQPYFWAPFVIVAGGA